MVLVELGELLVVMVEVLVLALVELVLVDVLELVVESASPRGPEWQWFLSP